jgi:hypothetical protein
MKYSTDYFHGKLFCDGDEEERGREGRGEEDQEKSRPL